MSEDAHRGKNPQEASSLISASWKYIEPPLVGANARERETQISIDASHASGCTQSYSQHSMDTQVRRGAKELHLYKELLKF